MISDFKEQYEKKLVYSRNALPIFDSQDRSKPYSVLVLVKDSNNDVYTAYYDYKNSCWVSTSYGKMQPNLHFLWMHIPDKLHSSVALYNDERISYVKNKESDFD